MIIRIMGDNQYRLDDAQVAEIDHLDDRVVAAMQAGDSAAFATALQTLVTFVQQRGTPVPVEEVIPSDAILPAPDMSLEETQQLLASEQIAWPTEIAGPQT